jgi:hypothetical protein
MRDALPVGVVVALTALVLAPGVALAGRLAPELDPNLGIAGLALLSGAAAFVIERSRRRPK